ncbi:MAG: type VII secretion-associated protein, partial [Actinomycetota bacterium]|nr:type VII secretion-associated protein [Actinomycetota bacterium]
KRRIDEGELLLGDTVLTVAEVMRAVLARVLSEAERWAGGAAVDELVLTHPAGWGAVRTGVLHQAARGLADRVLLVSEPVAAALFYLRQIAPGGPLRADGATLAVLDLGGGTVDASVVQRCARQPAGFRVLAGRGDPTFGGADIDQVLLEHIGTAVAAADPPGWRALVEGRELADRRRRRVLRADVRTAKETLSRHPYADVPLPPPFPDAHLTRADLERLVGDRILAAVGLLSSVLHTAGVDRPAGVFLVGGSSRIPMVARLVHERLGDAPVTLDQPDTVVARGALDVYADTRPAPPPRPLPQLPPQPTPPVVPTTPSPATAPPAHTVAQRPSPGRSPAADPSPPPDQSLAPDRLPAPAMPATDGPVLMSGARPHRARLAVAVTLCVLAVTTLTVVLLPRTDQDSVARHHYQFTLPDGWSEAAGNPDLLQVRIVPDNSTGPEAILVQQTRLGYDATLAPQRGPGEIAELLAAEDPAQYSGFEPAARFAGRDVVRYRQRPGDGSTVEWYVLFEHTVQISIGCRAKPPATAAVDRACRIVVASLQVQP